MEAEENQAQDEYETRKATNHTACDGADICLAGTASARRTCSAAGDGTCGCSGCERWDASEVDGEIGIGPIAGLRSRCASGRPV